MDKILNLIESVLEGFPSYSSERPEQRGIDAAIPRLNSSVLSTTLPPLLSKLVDVLN